MRLAEVLARFAAERLWGSVTIHFTGGRASHIQEHRTARPSADRKLAAIVGSHPEVAASLAAGESNEFVFARVRSGQLVLIAVEIHHTQEADRVEPHPAPQAVGAADHQHGTPRPADARRA